MQTQTSTYTIADGELTDARSSAVSWGAIFAGAAAAAALSLILLILGVGLGLSAVSPWSTSNPSAAALGVSTIAWITFIQLAASGLGGYLAGRLRVRWASVHGDEVFFRDTAHGLLAWAMATLFTAAALTGTISNVLGDLVQTSAETAAPAVVAATHSPGTTVKPTDYYTDMLLRSNQSAADTREEVGRILNTALDEGKLAPDDRTYLGSLIARRTNVSQSEGEAKADEIYTRAQKAIADVKDAAEKARKAATHSALWMFMALLIGAFIASYTATIGGRLRDDINIHTTRT